MPTVRDGVLTVVTKDKSRDLPVGRLYRYESFDQFKNQQEVELRMEAQDFSQALLKVFEQVATKINGLAWRDYREKCQRSSGFVSR
jgi:hypothetical protein